MKNLIAIILALILSFSTIVHSHAQATESIWLVANTTAYRTGETVIVTVNAATVVPIQGFTFQIRYDPACLEPIAAVSPISGMNGLNLPQTTGLVDASFASTAPQNINGILAEVRFKALTGCQTNLVLESAALAVRNGSGFAAPLPGVTIGASTIALNVDSAVGSAQAPETLSGAALPLAVAPSKSTLGLPGLVLILFVVVAAAGALLVAALFFLRRPTQAMRSVPARQPARQVTVQFKHGQYAGKSYILTKLPCAIGRDATNDICINDPYISRQHIKIYSADNSYYLQDLGGETYINGHAIKQASAVLRPGDVVRLGKSALFTFGA